MAVATREFGLFINGETVEGSSTRYVAVETGMFARGRVEITGGDLRPGQLVVVPR